MNLILITSDELDATGRAHLTDQRAGHIHSVLKPEIGQELRVGLLNGPLGRGVIEAVSASLVTLACEFDAEPPPRPAIDLLLAMPRPKVLKRLWAQLAALGVGRIILTNAEKVERFYFDTHVLEPDFYNARLIEGLQQARDTHLPDVTIVKNLKPFLENELFPNIGPERSERGPGVLAAGQRPQGVAKKILADPSGNRSLFQCLEKNEKKVPNIGTDCVGIQRFASQGQSILLGVGPEGGWTPYELELFKAHGFELFSMGPRILRTDTACVALLAQLNQLFTLAQV